MFVVSQFKVFSLWSSGSVALNPVAEEQSAEIWKSKTLTSGQSAKNEIGGGPGFYDHF